MMIGILTPLLITTSPLNPNTLIQEFRTWESEQNRTSIEDTLNSALIMEDEKYGCDDSTEQEELLQLPSGEDKQGSRRRHDRRDTGPWIFLDEEGESPNCWCGHPREKDTEPGRKGTGD